MRDAFGAFAAYGAGIETALLPDHAGEKFDGKRILCHVLLHGAADITAAVLPASDLTALEHSPTDLAQPFMWLSAVRLRSTMLRRDVGNSIAAKSSKEVSVRETVSIVKPR